MCCKGRKLINKSRINYNWIWVIYGAEFYEKFTIPTYFLYYINILTLIIKFVNDEYKLNWRFPLLCFGSTLHCDKSQRFKPFYRDFMGDIVYSEC